VPVPALGIHRPAVEGDGIGVFALDWFLFCLFMRFTSTLPGFDERQDFDNVLMGGWNADEPGFCAAYSDYPGVDART
jgi:hypothetical protein